MDTTATTQTQVKRIIWFGMLFVFFVMGAVIVLSDESKTGGIKDGVSVIAIITAAAVGIERIIETFWTIMGFHKGTYWPMKVLQIQAKGRIDDLNSSLNPVIEDINRFLDNLQENEKLIGEKVNFAKEQLNKLKSDLNDIRQLAPGFNQIQLLKGWIEQARFLGNKFDHKVYGDRFNDIASKIQTGYDITSISLNALTNMALSFKDNPIRRLISIYAGVSLGIIIAGVFGLDIFQAVLRNPVEKYRQAQEILTGIVIGLGAAPTHELIRAIQEYKESKK